MTMELSRRIFLSSAASTLAIASLASCSASGGATAPAGGGSVRLPDYMPFSGVTPDLAGNADGLAQGFYTYPAKPQQVITEPPGDGSKVSILVESPGTTPSPLDQNAYWQHLNKSVGASLAFTVIPTANWLEKFATATAGGDLPDVVEVWAPPARAEMMPALFQDLSQYVSGSAVRDYPFLANLPTAAWEMCVFNGGIYGVPIPRGAMSSLILYTRDDLIRKKGLNASPANFDEFFELAKGLTDERSNSWAFGGVPWELVQQMYGLPPAWTMKNGKLVSSNELDETIEAIEACLKLANAGTFAPDSFNANVGTLRKQWFSAGSVAMVSDTFPAWSGYLASQTVGESYDLGAMHLPGANGGEATRWLGNPIHNITSFKKTSDEKRIITLLKIVNYLAAPFGTAEYLSNVFGAPSANYTLTGSDPVVTPRTKNETGLSVQYVGAPPQVFYSPGRPETIRKQHSAQTAVVENGIADPTLRLISKTNASRGAQLNQKLADARNDIWQGRAKVSSWKDTVADWKKSGGQSITDEFSRALDEGGRP